MANSGSIQGSWSGSNAQYLKLRCDWEVTSQNTTNKTSTVTLHWIAQKTTSNLSTYKQNAPWSRNVAGSAANGTVNFNIGNTAANTDYEFLTQTGIVIQHDANGTKTASLSGTIDLSGTSAGTGSFSGSMELPTIATTPPTVSSLAISDQGTGYNTVGAYVAGFTKFKLTASATAVSPATIARYDFYNGNTLLQSGPSNTYTYPSANAAGAYNFKVIVTDSYGNATTKTASAVTVLAYTMPTLTATTFRCNSGGTADSSGAYASLKMTWTIASVGNNAVQIHKVTFMGSDTTLTSGTAVVKSGVSTSSSYPAVYTVTDKFGAAGLVPATTATQTVLSESINFDLYPSASGGMGVGMVAESGVASFNMPVKVLNSINVTPNGNYPEVNFKTLSDTSRGGALTKTTGANLNQFYFQQYHRSNGINNNYMDSYWLPVSGTDNSNHTYNIFTSNITQLSPTAASGVTINNNSSFRVGNLVVINVRITLSSAKSVDSEILSGFPAPRSSISNAGVIACSSNRADTTFVILTDGKLSAGTSATARMYIISAIYFTA